MEQKLTVDQARKLLPRAAGISNADFKALLEERRPEVVKSKSLSLVLFALRPPQSPGAAKDREFRVLGEDLRVSDVTDAMWISKDRGYASFLQAKYITGCTCKSTARRAEGVVTFKSDLFAGRIPFVAQATRDGWVITTPSAAVQDQVVLGKEGFGQEARPHGRTGRQEAESGSLHRLGQRNQRPSRGRFRPGERRATTTARRSQKWCRFATSARKTQFSTKEFARPTAVTDSKASRSPGEHDSGVAHPVEVNLASGKEIELHD